MCVCVCVCVCVLCDFFVVAPYLFPFKINFKILEMKVILCIVQGGEKTEK